MDEIPWQFWGLVLILVMAAAAALAAAVIVSRSRVLRDDRTHKKQSQLMERMVKIITLWDELHEESQRIERELTEITRECVVTGGEIWTPTQGSGTNSVLLEGTIATLHSTMTIFRSLDHSIRRLCTITMEWLNATGEQRMKLHAEMISFADSSARLIPMARSQLADYVNEVQELVRIGVTGNAQTRIGKSLHGMQPLVLGMELVDELRGFLREVILV